MHTHQSGRIPARHSDMQAARQLQSKRRRAWSRGCALMLSLAAAQVFAQAPASAPSSSGSPDALANLEVYDLLIGTYTGSGKSEGIYVYRFNTGSGELTRLASAQTVNPSYLVVNRDRNYVYAVNELPGDKGPASQRGGISAFRFDRASGQLSFLNRVSSDGNDPCYLALSPDGKYLLTANYSVVANPGGSFAVFPLACDGHVGASVLTVHHEGGGPVKGRQDNSHVHSTVFSPDGKYLFAQDLGVDKVYAYHRYTPDPSATSRGLFGPTDARYTPSPAPARAIWCSTRAANTRI